MDYYLVLFEAGKAGTWLTWLINQHNNFPQYPKVVRHNMEDWGVGGECWGETKWVTVDGAGWYVDDDDCFKKETFEESRNRNPSNALKDCVKVIPNHPCRKSHNLVDQELFQHIIDEVKPKVVIVPIVTEMIDEFADRWTIIKKFQSGEDQDDRKDWIEWQKYLEVDKPYDRPTHKVHYVDIGKMLNGHMEEYWDLAEAIDEEPLENIEEVIDDFIKFFV